LLRNTREPQQIGHLEVDDQVLVVARITDEGGVLAVPRKITRRRGVYQELDTAR